MNLELSILKRNANNFKLILNNVILNLWHIEDTNIDYINAKKQYDIAKQQGKHFEAAKQFAIMSAKAPIITEQIGKLIISTAWTAV